MMGEHFTIRNRQLSKRLLLWFVIACFLGVVLTYIFLTIFAPFLTEHSRPDSIVQSEITSLETRSQGAIKNYDRLIIPKLGIDLGIYTSGYDAMDKGVWHRFSEMGDPTKDGNFILTGHRFTLGNSPAETTYKSPFFHIDKLEVGDDIFVEWSGKIYHYEIDKIYEVEPTQTEIEEQTDCKRLTFYTCTLGGHEEGRVVIEALPVI
jgi:LPXTG-site transpeptidase (sortase) family protein